jgi:hypothetical protein
MFSGLPSIANIAWPRPIDLASSPSSRVDYYPPLGRVGFSCLMYSRRKGMESQLLCHSQAIVFRAITIWALARFMLTAGRFDNFNLKYSGRMLPMNGSNNDSCAGRSVVSISNLANGALGEHLRQDTDGMRLEIAPPGCLSKRNPAMKPKQPPGPPMTLGNMRELGRGG